MENTTENTNEQDNVIAPEVEATIAPETEAVNTGTDKDAEEIDNTEKVEINQINDSNAGISTLTKEEFSDRLHSALEKHIPEGGISDKAEALQFVRHLGRQISNYFPEIPTGHIINLISLMLNGEYQNDKMLTLIEEMPIGGYGY